MEEQALDHYRKGEFAEAEALFRQMLDDEPDNAQVLFLLSLTRQQQDDFEQPVELLQRAIAAQPGNATLQYALGSVYLRRRELDPANAAFEKAVEIDPNYAEAQSALAWVALSRGDWQGAEQTLRHALKSDARNVDALIKMGMALYEQGQNDEAIRYLQQALSIDADQPAAHFHLGRAFMAADNPGFAQQCFQNALDAQPASLEALEWLARAQAESGQNQDAVETWTRLLDSVGDQPGVLVGLARARRNLGELDAAVGLYMRASRLMPEDSDLVVELARVERDLGRWPDVIRRYQSLPEEVSATPGARELIAEALLETGRQDEALDMIRGLLGEGAPSPRSRLLFARILFDTGELDAAQSQLDRLLDEEIPMADAVLLRARRLLADGDLESAEGLLRDLQRRHDIRAGERISALTLLGNALHGAGRYQQAWEQYIGLPERAADVMVMAHEQPPRLEADEPPRTAMSRDVAWSWPPQPPADGRPEPVFVFAWPGSGRERLLAALDAHPDIAVIRDPVKDQAARREIIGHPRGATALNALGEPEQLLARRRYWKAARRARDFGDSFAVDAMWLPAEAIPTIYRVFPQARVVVLRREPRDMALEWLRSGFTGQDEMARVYRLQLEQLALCEEAVPLNYANVEWEALAGNPSDQLKELASALEIRWDPAMLDAFEATAVDDAVEPGDWAHYQDWLQSVFAALEGAQAAADDVLW